MVLSRHLGHCEKLKLKSHGRGGKQKEEYEVEEKNNLILEAEKTFSTS